MGILVYRDSPTGDRFVGRVDYAREAEASFEYDQGYLAAARAAGELGISETLPLDGRPFGAGEMGAFFKGLLPEGEVMTGLVELYQIPRNDYLALIEQLGCELDPSGSAPCQELARSTPISSQYSWHPVSVAV